MKKLLAGAAALLILAGCGSSTGKQEAKTCTMDYQGIPTTMKLDAEDNKVTVIEMNMEQDMKQDLSNITDDQKKQVDQIIYSSMGIMGDEEGLTAKADYEGTKVILTIKIDTTKASTDTLKKFSFDGGLKFDDSVKELETAGATCK